MDKNKDIDAGELISRLKRGEKLVILDVRESDEYFEGHIEGALSAPLGSIGLETLAEIELDPGAEGEIICCCLSGARSAVATQRIRSLGFSNVRNLRGGIMSLMSSR